MNLVLSWHCDVDADIERALQHDKAEEAGRLSQSIDAMTRILESWVLRSGGRLLGQDGAQGSSEMPAEHLDELPDIVRQCEQATDARMHVGVGAEPSEALVAMKYAQKHGGDPAITLYTPDLAEEDSEVAEGDEISEGEMEALEEHNEGLATPDQPFLGKAQFNEPRPAGEATQIQQGALSPSAAAPSAPPSASFSAPGQPPEQPDQPEAQQPGAPEDQLIQAVGGVLENFKQQLPFYEQQVKQANPQAYEAVMGMVQAMIAMAQKLTSGGPEAEPPPEAGGAQSAPPAPAQKSERRTYTEVELKKALAEGVVPCASCGQPWHDQSGFLISKDPSDPSKGNFPFCQGCMASVIDQKVKDEGRTHKVTSQRKVPTPGNPGKNLRLAFNAYNTPYADMPDVGMPVKKGEETKVEVDPAAPKMPEDQLRKLYDAAKAEMVKEEWTGAKVPEFNPEEFSTGFYHERREHPHLDDHQTTMTTLQHLAEDPSYYSKIQSLEESGMLGKEEVKPAAHHHLNLPPGSVGVGSKARSVKVVEPATGKAVWHQVSMGRKASGDGHALSPRVTECPSADSPDKRMVDAGLAPSPTGE